MAIGRISGPMLTSNLVRNGEDIAIESNLLYFSVSDSDPVNFKIGINTDAPSYLLDIFGITRSTNIKSTEVDIGNVNIKTNTVKSSLGNLLLQAATSSDNIVLSSNLTSSNNVSFTGQTTISSINKVGITAPLNNATLTLADGSTLATSGSYSITLTATANSNVTLPENGTLVNSSVTTLSSLTGVGTITSGTWSGSFGVVSGSNLTNLSASNLSGTISSTVLGNSSVYIGTTGIALNRTTGNLTLSGVAFDSTSASTSFTLPSGDSSSRPGAPVSGNIRYNTTTSYFEGYNGSTWGQVGTVISGSGLNSTPIKTANYTASLIDLVRANSTNGSFNIQFPKDPPDGSVIAVMDVAYTFQAHPVSVIPGIGNTIEGVSDSFILDINGAYVPFVYIQSTTNWRMEITPTV